jgi:hypothetical protein
MFTLGIVNREWFLLSTRPLPRVSMLSRPLPKPALPTVALAHRVPRLVVVLRQAAHPVPLPLAALLGTAAAPQLSSPLWVLQPVYCCSVMCRFMCRWDKLDIAGYHINFCVVFLYTLSLTFDNVCHIIGRMNAIQLIGQWPPINLNFGNVASCVDQMFPQKEPQGLRPFYHSVDCEVCYPASPSAAKKQKLWIRYECQRSDLWFIAVFLSDRVADRKGHLQQIWNHSRWNAPFDRASSYI